MRSPLASFEKTNFILSTAICKHVSRCIDWLSAKQKAKWLNRVSACCGYSVVFEIPHCPWCLATKPQLCIDILESIVHESSKLANLNIFFTFWRFILILLQSRSDKTHQNSLLQIFNILLHRTLIGVEIFSLCTFFSWCSSSRSSSWEKIF